MFDVDDRAFRTKVAGVARALEETGVVQPVRTFFTTGDQQLVATSRRATVIPIGLRGDGRGAIERVIRVVDGAETDEFETAVTGEFTADRDFRDTLSEDLQRASSSSDCRRR